jgi:hypothetical protein
MVKKYQRNVLSLHFYHCFEHPIYQGQGFIICNSHDFKNLHNDFSIFIVFLNCRPKRFDSFFDFYEDSFSFSLAFRFVPTIAIEAQNIMDAQQSRGYEMQQKGIINQVKNLFPLLVPLIISSIKRAFNVAEALESRAFGSKKERTFYFTIKYSTKDWIFTIYLILLSITLIFIKIHFISMPLWFRWSLPV